MAVRLAVRRKGRSSLTEAFAYRRPKRLSGEREQQAEHDHQPEWQVEREVAAADDDVAR